MTSPKEMQELAQEASRSDAARAATTITREEFAAYVSGSKRRLTPYEADMQRYTSELTDRIRQNVLRPDDMELLIELLDEFVENEVCNTLAMMAGEYD